MHSFTQSPAFASAPAASGLRKQPPSVGLQLYQTPRATPSSSSRFDARIMHRVVPPTLFDAHVLLDAPIPKLASFFHLPLALVNSHWLTTTSPLDLPPSTAHKVSHHHQTQTNTPSLSSQQQHRQPLTPHTANRYNDLAAALASKLAAHLATLQPEQHSHGKSSNQQQHHQTTFSSSTNRPSRARIQRILDQTGFSAAPRLQPPTVTDPDSSRSTHPPSALYTNNSAQHNRSRSRHRPVCAFSSLAVHPHLTLENNRFDLHKRVPSLYRLARAAAPLPSHLPSYAEFTILDAAGVGGLALGVAPSSLPLNTLPGTDETSAALHSAGKVITATDDWLPAGPALCNGDVVGVAVNRDTAPDTLVSFFVNGVLVGSRTIQDKQSHTQQLHFVASLYRQGACVRLACCPSDWVFFAEASRVVKGLRPACLAEEDIEAEMSSTSAASRSGGSVSRNRQSPVNSNRSVATAGSNFVRGKGDARSCGSVLSPVDEFMSV